MRPPCLTPEELTAALAALPGWELDGEALARRFRFADFAGAFAFMTAVAADAEELDHHPEWTNVYSSVAVRLTTHDACGITALDIELARRIDAHAEACSGGGGG